MKSVLILCACLLMSAGCAQKQQEPEPKFDKTVSIKVTKDGQLFYEKKPVTIEELGDELKRLDNKNTSVCYYREAADTEPHPIAKQVIDKIVANRLAIELSMKECP